jgi:hypothetical protein
MKKFITALAATFATVVIGSAASAATPTFNVYHEEVLPALVEANTPATFSVYHEEVLSELVAANTPPTFNVVREEILPAMNRVVADADPFAEQIVGGIGPQLPYDPMRGVDYGFVQALNKLNADPYSEQIVGGIGPQSDLDPMLTVMTDWVQPASNVDPFSEEVVGGLGPQINFVASN